MNWHISRRRWKRLMRAMRGNTMEDEIVVSVWNAEKMLAEPNPKSASARKKAWLLQRLDHEAPDVVFLLEVMGEPKALLDFRRHLRKCGYDCRWLVGEGGSSRLDKGTSSWTNGSAVVKGVG